MNSRDGYPGVHFNNISWPSLYNPAIEVEFFGSPARLGGYYLSSPDEVFKFTLYWTLIFHIPFSLTAGLYALANFAWMPVKIKSSDVLLTEHLHIHTHSRTGSHAGSYLSHPSTPSQAGDWPNLPHRLNARRSRITFSLIILLVFLLSSVMSALVGAAVVSAVLVGVYRAGGFYMSTWIPFVWAVIQSLIGLLEIWPSVVDII